MYTCTICTYCTCSSICCVLKILLYCIYLLFTILLSCFCRTLVWITESSARWRLTVQSTSSHSPTTAARWNQTSIRPSRTFPFKFCNCHLFSHAPAVFVFTSLKRPVRVIIDVNGDLLEPVSLCGLYSQDLVSCLNGFALLWRVLCRFGTFVVGLRSATTDRGSPFVCLKCSPGCKIDQCVFFSF